jgi:hypothetical protein
MSSIPTTYNGIRFRSRLEAKWACMFDQLGWRWHYEPLDLNGWIPDFLLESEKNHVLVEVKPTTDFDDATIRKIEAAFGYVDSGDESLPYITDEYHILLCGLGVFKPNDEYGDPNSIGWLLDNGWGCGWNDAVIIYPRHNKGKWGLTSGITGCWADVLRDDYGKHLCDYASFEDIQRFWATACNVTQWRAPQ